MLKLSNLKIDVDVFNTIPTPADLKSYLKRYLENTYKTKITDVKILKKSIDARYAQLKYIFSIAFASSDEQKLMRKYHLSCYLEEDSLTNLIKDKQKPINKHIVIIGMGPSGIFNALILARLGFKVTLIERGKKVEDRVRDVEAFFEGNSLNNESNIQFGEGGAGTFSDGKLNTNISSPYIKYILKTFYEHGASEEILYEAKPHVGTDVLRNVLINIRHTLINLGVKIFFETKLIDFDQQACYCLNKGNKLTFTYDTLVFATGHSATDIYELLKRKHILMKPKPFSMGVRIEHLQEDINLARYHKHHHNLPPADYKCAVHLNNLRSLYTFCMCPGGEVVNASSEKGYLVTNGMSNFQRNKPNANAAILVNVEVNDFYHGDILDGINYQKHYEHLAYKLGNGHVICQKYHDFVNKTPSTSFEKIIPSVKPTIFKGNLWEVLPSYVCETMILGIEKMGSLIPGFNDPDSVLSGIETRSSSPIQVVRDEHFATSFNNIYAIGEGAGHAGGIVTSALDGIKIALAIFEKYQ